MKDINNDKLFFNIFRNKYLNYCIFKNLNNREKLLGYFKYDDIISSEWCIKNQYYELLQLKIQRGDYVVFNMHENSTEPRNQIRTQYDNGRILFYYRNSIFHKQVAVKGQWNSNNFYNHLFKNYSKYYVDNGNLVESEFIAIEYDNIHVLNTLATCYNYKFNFESFYRAVEIGSYECALFIFGKINIKKKEFEKLWEMVLQSNKKSQNEYINISVGLLLNERLEFLVNKCKISVSKDQFKLTFLFDFIIFDQTLKVLIKSAKSIILLRDQLKPFIQSIIKGNFKYDRSRLKGSELDKIILKEKQLIEFNDSIELFKTISEIDNLILKVTRKQMASLVCDFNSLQDGNGVGNNNDEENINVIVYKLFKFVLPFTEFKSNFFSDNLNYFKLKYYNKSTQINPPIRFYNLASFGIYDFNKLKTEGIEVFSRVFKYCKNDKSIQENYINCLIKDINQFGVQGTLLSDALISIFVDLVSYSNLELVKLILDSNIPLKFTNDIISIGRVYRNINSTEMFDLVYNSTQIQSLINNSNDKLSIIDLFLFDNNPKLLGHLKENYPQIYYKEIQLINVNPSKLSLDTLKFVYDNIQDFIYESVNIWTSTSTLLFESPQHYKYIIDKTPSGRNYYYNSPCFKDEVGIFNYIFNNKLIDLKTKRCIIQNSFFEHYYTFLKIKQKRINIHNNNKIENNNNNDNIFNNEIIEFLKSIPKVDDLLTILEYEIGDYSNTWFLDLAINYYQGQQLKVFLFSTIKIISFYDRISVFRYLYSTYPQLINKLFEENHSHQYNNNRILMNAIRSGNIELVLEMLKSSFFDKIKTEFDYHKFLLSSSCNIITSNNHLFLNYFKNYKS